MDETLIPDSMCRSPRFLIDCWEGNGRQCLKGPSYWSFSQQALQSRAHLAIAMLTSSSPIARDVLPSQILGQAFDLSATSTGNDHVSTSTTLENMFSSPHLEQSMPNLLASTSLSDILISRFSEIMAAFRQSPNLSTARCSELSSRTGLEMVRCCELVASIFADLLQLLASPSLLRKTQCSS